MISIDINGISNDLNNENIKMNILDKDIERVGEIHEDKKERKTIILDKNAIYF